VGRSLNHTTLYTKAQILSIGLLLIVLTPTAAHAYRCTQVDEADPASTSISWPKRRIEFRLHESGTQDITDDGEFQALEEAFDEWERAYSVWDKNASCEDSEFGNQTDLELHSSSQRSASTFIGYNYLVTEQNENLVIFHDDTWPHAGTENSVVGLTTVSYSSGNGVIFDADIEFNAYGFEFSVGEPVLMDLKNAAVHEIGHFLGLAHSDAEDSTMAASATEGETYKRDLSCDDATAIVLKYPSSSANGFCSQSLECQTHRCYPPQLYPYVLKASVVQGGCAAIHRPESLFWVGLMMIIPCALAFKEFRSGRRSKEVSL
jgi:predicted Zn-dependent protease